MIGVALQKVCPCLRKSSEMRVSQTVDIPWYSGVRDIKQTRAHFVAVYRNENLDFLLLSFYSVLRVLWELLGSVSSSHQRSECGGLQTTDREGQWIWKKLWDKCGLKMNFRMSLV